MCVADVCQYWSHIFAHCPVTFFPTGSDIILNTPFSNSLKLTFLDYWSPVVAMRLNAPDFPLQYLCIFFKYSYLSEIVLYEQNNLHVSDDTQMSVISWTRDFVYLWIPFTRPNAISLYSPFPWSAKPASYL